MEHRTAVVRTAALRAFSVVCALMVLAAVAIAAPAPASAATTVPCTPWVPGNALWSSGAHERLSCSAASSTDYSPDRWQRATSRFTVQAFTHGRTATMSFDISDMQYYWGLKWYGNKYRTQADFVVRIQKDGQYWGRIAHVRRDLDGRSARLDLDVDIPEGDFRIEFVGGLTGMFWGFPNGNHNGYPGVTDVSKHVFVDVHNPGGSDEPLIMR